MFLCRTAWQRCGHLARKSAYQLSRDVLPRRQMSSLPGGAGDNIIYALLCGGAFAGAVAYTYSTVTTDHARFTDRIADINARPKTEWVPKPWPPKSRDEEEEGEEAVADGEEEAEEAAAEEAVEAENVAEPAEEAEAVSEEPAVEAAVEEVAVVEAETVVEEIAEAVAEVAEEVVEVAKEVEAAAEEVVIVAEAVEDAAEAIAVPAIAEEAVAVAEPESNGTAAQEEVAPEAAVTAE
ncbi:protein MGARP-like isoform X1 [Salvelinus fontinalis]|uniref:protein MGARP-like isoform X1 n=1 Tax=Salvelinus fontinalis TaxID=8038 RepID=UPI0024855791|nr:protein MGARP-like isoform X1 [Salvelinus fontinalis]